jgi:hypothetical protein
MREDRIAASPFLIPSLGHYTKRIRGKLQHYWENPRWLGHSSAQTALRYERRCGQFRGALVVAGCKLPGSGVRIRGAAVVSPFVPRKGRSFAGAKDNNAPTTNYYY